jgi:mannose-6-phosphate isomerase
MTLKSIPPRPYKLFNKIQNYDWGTKNEDAFIPKFLGVKPEKDLPYGELWIGAHPKAPSEIEIEGTKYPLNTVIDIFPKEVLGKAVAKKHGGKFPFLLKVLSAARALSIQLHPNKKQAEYLHAKDPKNYPDDNHKPEIAIAMDSLTALAGFRPANQIKEILIKCPELKEYVGGIDYEMLIKTDNEKDLKEIIKMVYKTIMENADDKEKLENVINNLVERLSKQNHRTLEEEQFLVQQKLYGFDVGLLSFFFFNIIQLKAGQAFFTEAGVPHAYIKGNIIECMANSDNVVRAGLTGKFKDVKTLLKIMNYSFGEIDIINIKQKEDEIVYKTAAAEFEVSGYMKNKGSYHKLITEDKPIVVLIESGSLQVDWMIGEEKKSATFGKGESFISPAALSEFSLFMLENTKYYIVIIPD